MSDPMNVKVSFPVIAAILVIAVVLAGEVVTFTSPATLGAYGSSVETDTDEVSFSIECRGAQVYDVLSLDGTLGPLEDVSIYYDPAQAATIEKGHASTGARHLDENYYVEQIPHTLKVRGVCDVRVLDASDMEALVSAPGVGHALIMLSGTMPDTVYDGTESSPILKWIGSGGRLYWIGDILGRYISHGDSVETVENGTSVVLGSECIDDVEGRGSDVIGNGFCRSLYLQCDSTTFGVIPDRLPTDADYLCVGFSDGLRSSVTLVALGQGMVCVMGGEYSIFQRIDLAQVIASGIGPDSRILGCEKGNIYGSVEGNIPRGDSVYVIIGRDYAAYCERHEVS